MTEGKKNSEKQKKENLRRIGRRLETIEKELSDIEEDLEKHRTEEPGLVDEDIKRRQKRVQAGKTAVEAEERPQLEYKGIKLFYWKFVSRLKKALK